MGVAASSLCSAAHLQDWQNEVHMLGTYNHPNIMRCECYTSCQPSASSTQALLPCPAAPLRPCPSAPLLP